MKRNFIANLDVFAYLSTLPDDSVNCVVTSPPYWGLRDYGVDGQLGMEPTLGEFLYSLVDVFREVRRVLRPDGVCWVNMGDSYAANRGYQVPDSKHVDVGNHGPSKVPSGFKPKDLIAQSWMLALALQADGWWLRSGIPWLKTNPMPESTKDRPSTANEYIFLLTKSERYWYDHIAIRQAAQPASVARSLRGVSHKTKTIDGAPGQSPHSINQPRPNANKQNVLGKRQYVGFNERYEASGLTTAERRTSWWYNESTAGYIDALRWLREHPGEVDTVLAELECWQESGITLDENGMLLAISTSTSQMKAAHFATFSPRLIEPLLLAGCPPHTCATCGTPYTRVTEKTFVHQEDVSQAKGVKGSGKQKPDAGNRDGTPRGRVIYSTLGWEAGCDCGAEPIPGVVLDPFMGSGTVALVALQHHRDYVGCELSPEYLKIAQKRLTKGLSPDDKERIEKGRNLKLWDY